MYMHSMSEYLFNVRNFEITSIEIKFSVYSSDFETYKKGISEV